MGRNGRLLDVKVFDRSSLAQVKASLFKLNKLFGVQLDNQETPSVLINGVLNFINRCRRTGLKVHVRRSRRIRLIVPMRFSRGRGAYQHENH